MKYQVGDDILVLHSNEEGKVIEILNDKMVMIEVRGVKFPAYMDQIDFPYFHRFTKKKVVEEKPKPKIYIENIPKEKPKPSTIKTEDGVWLTLIPKFTLDEFNDEVAELFKVHLVNKTGTAYNFTYNHNLKGETVFGLKNSINALHDFYLHDIAFETMNDSPTFDFEFELATPVKKKAAFFETGIKLKPKQVFKRTEELKEKNESFISYKLFDVYPDEVKEEKHDLSLLANKGYKIYDAKQIRQHLQQPRSVVDLHIEKITNDWEGLSNHEILTIQLREFEKWYDLAVTHIQPSLTVIHGVGKGRLKEEIHDLLKTRKEVKSFINQYDGRLGYGATEIFFGY